MSQDELVHIVRTYIVDAVSGATTAMFITPGAYSYSTPGSLAVMPDGYQQTLQQQVYKFSVSILEISILVS